MKNFRIKGYYNISDVKYDLLKIIAPHDGYMFNDVEISQVTKLFGSFLSDLQNSNHIFNYDIFATDKENAVTFDIQIRMQKDRSPKKLKIHVGKITGRDVGWTAEAVAAYGVTADA